MRDLHKVPLSEDQTFKDLVSEYGSLLRPLTVVEILGHYRYERLQDSPLLGEVGVCTYNRGSEAIWEADCRADMFLCGSSVLVKTPVC